MLGAFANARCPGKFLYNNVVQAYGLIADLEPLVTKFLQDGKLTPADVESWSEEELKFLSGLKSEPAQDVLAIGYVELLDDLQRAEYVTRTHIAVALTNGQGGHAREA